VQEVRLFLLGHGRRGKTSLARALQDPSGLAAPIHEDDRTVGLNVWRGWRPQGGDIQVTRSAQSVDEACTLAQCFQRDWVDALNFMWLAEVHAQED